ncbi:putative tubulin--tyrosine ligase pby1 [Savitreella phatthalungensis]
MHILMTNDDGPPAADSPYIKPLWDRIRSSTDWKTTVALPSSQKSWIGKAIFVSDKVRLTRWDAAAGARLDSAPSKQDDDPNLWYLLSGTPATCTSIGIHHLCTSRPDLVLSGPNFGRNTSSLAALSSGTIGAALEGVGAGVRGIAVSYAIWPKQSEPQWVDAATNLVIRLVKYLVDNWDDGVDLYTINVPLCKELIDGTAKVYFTHIHQATHSSLFQPSQAPMTEAKLRLGEQATAPVFEFRPRFEDIAAKIDSDHGRKSDTWVVASHNVSVTPLKANFMHVDLAREREIKL